ncbi:MULTISPECIES: cyanophycinase [unclassified Nannocystis]|uniref:cyanophycinase n=1 Tax=unclassified Nannocystis TaxID=2627009 RepID=UPI0023EE89FF|nr:MULTISPECIES: cyanophycinase [unclassified Nannocystis]
MRALREVCLVSPARIEEHHSRGWIVPVGGAEEKEQDPVILRRFVEVSGGAGARIAVIPTASRLPDTGARYEKIFRQLGAHSARALPFETRADAEREDWLGILEHATGVFFTGGNQLQLSTILGGTPVAKSIRKLNARGVTVGGTSAGAAILSEHMIAFGQGGATPKAGLASLAPGFGLTNRVVIDQHFRQRDRLGRLLSVLAFNPFAVGIGLDEDTAAFLGPDDVMHVDGAGAITLVDVANLEHSSMAFAKPGQPICLTGIKLHILTKGARYNFVTREAVPPLPPPDDDD